MFKPILFSTAMVQAILDGMKTQTRRIAKFSGNPLWTGYVADGLTIYGSNNTPASHAPYKPGDILWVRETWANCTLSGVPLENGIAYKADATETKYCALLWKPSIHMPREAARIFLRVLNVHAERIKQITAEDIRAEGLTSMAAWAKDMEIAQKEFANLWNSTIKKADLPKCGWDANPWVWVVEFERCDKPEEFLSQDGDPA